MKLEKGDYINISYVGQKDEFVLGFNHTQEKDRLLNYSTTGETSVGVPEANDVLKMLVILGLSPKLTKLLDGYKTEKVKTDRKKDDELPEEFKAICDALKFACDLPKPIEKYRRAPGILIDNYNFIYDLGLSKKGEQLFRLLKEKLGQKCFAFGNNELGYQIASTPENFDKFLDEFLTSITEIHQELSKNSGINV